MELSDECISTQNIIKLHKEYDSRTDKPWGNAKFFEMKQHDFYKQLLKHPLHDIIYSKLRLNRVEDNFGSLLGN